jgi:AcrR family transcriptional regulator
MAKRDELLGTIVSAFAEMGYRQATTAELSRRCQVQETVLYRIWPDKKAMFVDAIDNVADNVIGIYRQILHDAGEVDNPIKVLIEYESTHIGEFRNHRIVFAALPEANDPEVRGALQRMYHRIHCFIVEQLAKSPAGTAIDVDKTAWAIMGLGTIMTIMDDLTLTSSTQRQQMFLYAGESLLSHNESKH